MAEEAQTLVVTNAGQPLVAELPPVNDGQEDAQSVQAETASSKTVILTPVSD